MVSASSGFVAQEFPAALAIRSLYKSFGATQAVQNVDLNLPTGEILALLGQNGAGKSTLVKILAGVFAADAGEVFLYGKPCDLSRERHAIAFIHQDLGLIEWMTVAENIAMAQGYARRFGLIDWTRVEANARQSLQLIAPGIDPRRRVNDLTRTEKSLVAIARAVGVNARVLVLDEPTASLPKGDVEVLFSVLSEAPARTTPLPGGLALSPLTALPNRWRRDFRSARTCISIQRGRAA